MRSAFFAIFSAATSLAAEPFLELPIACELGRDCYIQAYVDRDAGPGRRDFNCGLRTRDGHRGTDFALLNFDQLDAGVAVLAAARGTVEAVRDKVPDLRPVQDQGERVGCGNGVRIGHANGLKTLYCHLAEGSIAVRVGQVVEAQQPIGLIGLSGQTTFPHVHFSLLSEDGQHIDPFSPGAETVDCPHDGPTYWAVDIPYQPSGFFTAGFSSAVPTMEAVASGSARATTIDRNQPLVLYAHLFHARHGDVLSFEGVGPGGEIFERSEVLKSPKPTLMRAFGRKAPPSGWPTGFYTGSLTLSRKGAVIGTRHAYVTVN